MRPAGRKPKLGNGCDWLICPSWIFWAPQLQHQCLGTLASRMWRAGLLRRQSYTCQPSFCPLCPLFCHIHAPAGLLALPTHAWALYLLQMSCLITYTLASIPTLWLQQALELCNHHHQPTLCSLLALDFSSRIISLELYFYGLIKNAEIQFSWTTQSEYLAAGPGN